MSAKTQLQFSPNQNGIAMIYDDNSSDELPHWTFGDAEGPSLASFWSTVEAGGTTQATAFYTLSPTADVMALSFSLNVPDGYKVYAASAGDDDGSGLLASYTCRIPIVDYMDELKVQIDSASSVDRPQYQLGSSSSDAAEGNSFADGWLSAAAAAQAQPFQTLYAPADAIGASVESDGLAGFAADAKGGPGGNPGGGGGGGGGGGSGLLTTYTSGNQNVDDANEFNIQIDFSGKWTASQQAIVTWAADFYSQIITADIHDDTDLSGNLVDDIVISVSTARIDGNGNPLFGNVLAQTGNIIVRDPGAIDQWLPLTASITLDSTDLKNSAFADAWDDIILHEMGHALGFIGTIFEQLGLVDNSGNFTGTNATAAYGGLVPLENDGGSGTAGSHWDETGFMPDGVQMSNELMTGYFVPGEQTYLSDTTVGALADLGYTVQDPLVGSSYVVVDSHLLLA
jgi:hypothetical protein